MIRLDRVEAGYRAGEPILSGLDAELADGTVTGVMGPSGSGKSTLLAVVGLLLTPWTGRVLFDGQDVGSLSDAARSRRRASTIGFVFQDAALDPSRTVLDNIVEGALYARLDRRAALERGRQLMERFEVDLRADHRPGEVSGGQAQRVALCRALLPDPAVILADEPTGNLDARTAGLVVDALLSLAHTRGKTVVIATHSAEVAASCDERISL